VNAHYPGGETSRRNRRTALVLASVAAAFMIGFVIKIWLK
jgi:hypothetical protein